jgi:hypothetical protein
LEEAQARSLSAGSLRALVLVEDDLDDMLEQLLSFLEGKFEVEVAFQKYLEDLTVLEQREIPVLLGHRSSPPFCEEYLEEYLLVKNIARIAGAVNRVHTWSLRQAAFPP